MISSKRIKSYEVSLFDDSAKIINIPEFIEVIFDGKFSFLYDVDFIDLTIWQAP